MIAVKRILVVCLTFCIASGCSDKGEHKVESQTVIQVDNHALTLAEFDEFFEPLRISYEDRQTETALRQVRLRFLLELVEEMTILRRAEELDLHITDNELDEAVGNVEEDYNEGSFNDMFMKQAISLETWKERLRRKLLVQKVIEQELFANISVKPEEIRDYYNKYGEEEAPGQRIRVRHILLGSQEEADRVLARIQKGEDFATLASLYSVAPESKGGGDMGYVALGYLPKCLEDPLFVLEKDAVSPVIKTSYGYHIFKVIDKEEAGAGITDAAIERIRRRVKEEKLETAYGPWLANLQSRYRITVNKEIIE